MFAWAGFFRFISYVFWLAIFHDRRIDKERLGFPLLEMPISYSMVIYSVKTFIGGCSLFFFGVNGLNHYYPAVPEIILSLNFSDFLLDEPWNAMAPLRLLFLNFRRYKGFSHTC